MKPVVIYHSTYGNTEHIAAMISQSLGEICGCELHHIDELAPIPAGADLLIVGSPTRSHGVDRAMKYYLEGLADSIPFGIGVAAFDTRLQVPELISGSAAKGIARKLTHLGGHLVIDPEGFYVEGHDGPLYDGELERAADWGRKIAASVALHA